MLEVASSAYIYECSDRLGGNVVHPGMVCRTRIRSQKFSCRTALVSQDELGVTSL